MKRIILSIMILIFLTGCSGLYNINSFILPDDLEFIALIKELNTPEKICKYMLDNFESEEHLYITLNPYELYNTKKGDCNDFATFGIFIANYHNYKTYMIKMLFPKPIYQVDTWHTIAVYEESNSLTVSENRCYWDGEYFEDFRTIMDVFIGWTKYIVYDYNMDIIETIDN